MPNWWFSFANVRDLLQSRRLEIVNGSKPCSTTGIRRAPRRGHPRCAVRRFLSHPGPLPWGEGEPFSPRRTIQTRWLSTGRCALFPLPEGEYVFSAQTKRGPGARDLSRRNAGTADPRWRISRPLRYPTFLRTEVRAPFARAVTMLNRYEGEGQSEGKLRELLSRISGHSRNCGTGRVLGRAGGFPKGL